MSSQARFLRLDGLTVFAAIAFVAGLVAIAALDRVGAPEGLIRAGGPMLALFGFAAFGLAARTADLSSFVAAGRRLPPVYGGLGVAAIAAGALTCLDGRGAPSSDPPILGLAIGLALAALVYAPLARRFGATSPADVAATRYAGSPPRIVSAAALGAAAALTAFAGYRVAVAAFENAVAPNRLAAEAVVAAVLVCGALPGGVKGVASCAAASGAALVGLALFAYASGSRIAVPPADVAAFALDLDLGSPAKLAPVVAAALASSGLFASAPPAAASRNPGSAFTAGLAAIAACLALAAAGVMAPASALDPAATSPVAASLFGAATLAGALSLALLGAYGASRALGVALAGPPQRFGPIPSLRLARMRAAELIVIASCAAGDSRGLLDPRAALAVAMALTLAFAAPILLLAAIPRAGVASASIGTLAALAVAAARLIPATGLPHPSELFETALPAAAAAFVAGALTSLVLPRRGSAPTPGPDPFATP